MSDSKRRIPDLEDLAAYIDGRLEGERKSQVEEHLLRDEVFYETYLETVSSLENERAETESLERPSEERPHEGPRETADSRTKPLEADEQGRVLEISSDQIQLETRDSHELVRADHESPTEPYAVVRFPKTPALPATYRRLVTAAGLAAAAVLAVVVSRPLLAPTSASQLAAELKTAQSIVRQEDWNLPEWARNRGSSDLLPTPEQRQGGAFRLGAWTVQIETALRAGEPQESEPAIARATRYSERLSLTLSTHCLDRLDTQQSGRLLEEEVARCEQELRADLERAEGSRFALGQWAETARLALLTGNTETLRSRVFRRATRKLDARGLPAGAQEQLKAIKDLLSAPYLNQEKLRTHLDKLIRELAGADLS